MHAKKTAFVVEHDFIMATYLADRVIVYDGVPGVEAHANAPMSLLDGMNMFLRQVSVPLSCQRCLTMVMKCVCCFFSLFVRVVSVLLN